MHIIIEGCDKTGKSTLAKYLSQELDMPIKKFSGPTEEEKEKWDPFYEYADFLVKEKVAHIIDRFHISEIVYGQVLRGESKIDNTDKRLLEALIKEVDCMAIYCHRSIEDIKNDFVKDKESYVLIDEIPQLIAKYRDEIALSNLNWNYYKIGDKMQLLADYYKINGGHV